MLLVTVGSTHFTALTQAALSEQFLSAVGKLGVDSVVVQYGQSSVPVKEGEFACGSVNVRVIKYTDDFENLVQQSTAVISHAGAGSILTALRAGKKLLVVPNTSLMDNHQVELARALESERYLAVSSVDDLVTSLGDWLGRQYTPFPPLQPERFGQLVDGVMGYP